MRKFLCFFIALILLYSCNSNDNKASELTVAAAANVQYAMHEIIESFEFKYKIKTHLITSSSGKITAQINAGAPYDIFVSADMKYPHSLYEAGLTTSLPIEYAKGSLVLWTASNEFTPSFELLKEKPINHIAIANTKTAPYGKAAEEVLRNLNLYEELKDKLVYGESIAQTTQFINSGAAELGFTAKSVVRSPLLREHGSYIEISTDLHTPIIQGMVSLKSQNPKKQEVQQLFIEFMNSKEAKEILTMYGYDF